MNKKTTFIAAMLLLTGGAAATAQCTATLGSSGACLPVTLQTTSGFSPDSILWFRNDTLIYTSVAAWDPHARTVAGNGVAGNDPEKVSGATSLRTDKDGNLYILETGVNPTRISRWAPGASAGTVVAQSAAIEDFDIDEAGNIYAASGSNGTILKWEAGSSPASAITLLSGIGYTYSVSVRKDTLFVASMVGGSKGDADVLINKYPPPLYNKPGQIITRPSGTGPGQFGALTLRATTGGDLYVCDYVKGDILLFAGGSSTPQSLLTGLGNGMRHIHPDESGNVYFTNHSTFSVELLRKDAAAPVTIFGGNGSGPDPDQLLAPYGVTTGNSGVYIADLHRIQFFGAQLEDTLEVLLPGSYHAASKEGSHCTAVTDPLILRPLPAATITPHPATADACEGYSVTLATTGPDAHTSIRWQHEEQETGHTDAEFEAQTSGAYRVIVRDNQSNCETASNSIAVTIHDNPAPEISDVNGTLHAGIFESYQWYRGTERIEQATGASYLPEESGSYTVTVTDRNGCTGTSAPYGLTLGITQAPDAASLRIFPNPARDLLQIRSDIPVRIILTGNDGRHIGTSENPKQIDISFLPAGIYHVVITDTAGRKLHTEKLIRTER